MVLPFLLATLGSFAFGPVGFALGSLAGLALQGRPKTYGARLNDLSVPTTNYGSPIPQGYGTFPVVGIPVWSPGKKEVKKSRTVGGFLFFGGTDIFNYYYFYTGTEILTSHEINGIVAVYINDNKVADFSGAVVTTAMEQSTGNFLKYVHFNYGSTPSTASPTAIKTLGGGITNKDEVPIYPGCAYVDYDLFPLEQFSNAVPTFKYIVSRNANISADSWTNVPGIPWQGRSLFGVARLKKEVYIIMGFSNTADLMDVWKSSDLINWERAPSVGNPQLGWDATIFAQQIRFTNLYNFRAVNWVTNELLVLFANQDPIEYIVCYGGETTNGKSWIQHSETELGSFIIGIAFNGKRWFDVVALSQTAFPKHSYGMCVARDSSISSSDIILLYGGESIPGYSATINPPAGGHNGANGGFYKNLYYSINGLSFAEIASDGGMDYRTNCILVEFKGEVYGFGGHVEPPGDSNISNVIYKKQPGFNGFLLHSNYFRKFFPVLSASLVTNSVTIENSIVKNNVFDNIGLSVVLSGADGGSFTVASIEADGSNTKIILNEALTGIVITEIYINDAPFNGAIWTGGVWRNKLVVIMANTSGGSSTLNVFTSNEGQVWTQDADLSPTPVTYGSGSYPEYFNFDEIIALLGGENSSQAVHNVVLRSQTPVTAASTITLSSIVSDIWENQLLRSADLLDVSDITTVLLHGAPNYDNSSPADYLEQLCIAFGIDVIETDKVYFRQRKNADTGITITTTELATYAENEQIPDIIHSIITNDLSVAVEVNVNYYNVSNDWKIDSATARIQTNKIDGTIEIDNQNKLDVNLSVCMTPEQARTTAHFILWNQLVSRKKIPVRLGINRIALEEGDVITLQTDDGNFTVRLEEFSNISKNIFEWQTSLENVTLYTVPDSEVGSLPVNNTQDSPLIDFNLNSQFLDIPSLFKNENNEYGFFIASNFSRESESKFNGYEVYRQTDPNINHYELIGSYNNPGIIGITQDNTALISNASEFLLDNASTLTIDLETGNLPELITMRDIYRYQGYFYYGGEIMAYSKAQPLGIFTNRKRYILSSLLRGRLGTEHKISTHTANDIFVFLEGLSDIFCGQSDIGKAINYKIVPIGTDYELVVPDSFTNNAIRRKPLPVSLLKAERNNSTLTWKITWSGRSRFSLGFNDSLFKVMSENEEHYKIEFYNSTYTNILFDTFIMFPKRVQGIETIPTFLLSSSMQISIFGGIQNTLYLRVYQLSDDYTLNSFLSETKQLTATVL